MAEGGVLPAAAPAVSFLDEISTFIDEQVVQYAPLFMHMFGYHFELKAQVSDKPDDDFPVGRQLLITISYERRPGIPTAGGINVLSASMLVHDTDQRPHLHSRVASKIQNLLTHTIRAQQYHQL